MWPRLLGVLTGAAIVAGAFLAYNSFLVSLSARTAPVPQQPAAPGQTTTPPMPVSDAEALRRSYHEKRRPFFERLLGKYPNYVGSIDTSTDLDTLDMIVAVDDPKLAARFVEDALNGDAARYAFRRLRFYVRTEPGTVTRLRLCAEAITVSPGSWRLVPH